MLSCGLHWQAVAFLYFFLFVNANVADHCGVMAGDGVGRIRSYALMGFFNGDLLPIQAKRGSLEFSLFAFMPKRHQVLR